MGYITETSYETGADADYAVRGSAANTKIGNSFQVSTTNPIARVVIKCYRFATGSGTNFIELRLAADHSLLATSGSVNNVSLPSSSDWVNFDFTAPFTPTASTLYEMWVCGDQSVGGGEYLMLAADSTSPAYASGTYILFDGSNYSTNATVDALFKIQSKTGEFLSLL